MIVRKNIFPVIFLFLLELIGLSHQLQLRTKRISLTEDIPIEILLLNQLQNDIPAELSISPSLQPTIEPNAVSTLAPTVAETPVPTVSIDLKELIPTSRPSYQFFLPMFGSPTFSPTFSPTEEETLAPSEDPTLTPVMFPSEYPNLLPSLEPTYPPSAVPTLEPTYSITEEPTAFPTVSPTVDSALSAKSFEPTIVPSITPTFAPTFAPTTEPFASSTNTPSSSGQYFTDSCSAWNTTLLVMQDFNRTTATIGLMDSNFNYSTSKLLFVKRNLTMSLRTFNLNKFPTQVSSYVSMASCVNQAGINHQYLTVSCSDSQKVNMMWLSFMSNRPFSVMCSNVRWISSICADNTYRACTNCTSPCASMSRPGESNFRWASAVGFHLQTYKNPWPEWSQRSIAHMFDTTVYVNVSFPGTVYCAALTETRSLNNPMSILMSPNVASVTLGDGSPLLSGKLTVNNLLPETIYQVVCLTVSLQQPMSIQLGRTADISRIMQSSEVIRTNSAPLPMIVVSFTDESIVVNEVSSPIGVRLAFSLGRNVTIIPVISYVSSELCFSGSFGDSNSNSEAVAQVAPSELFFDSYDPSTKFIYVQGSEIGCYDMRFFYRFAAEDPVEAYSILYPVDGIYEANPCSFGDCHANSTEYAGIPINCTAVPMIPSISLGSLTYDSSGMELMLTLSDNVDLGFIPAYVLNFPCPLVVTFNHSEQSKCRFSSPKILRISIPASLEGLNPGEMIELVGGVMKPVCPVKNASFCDTISYVPSQKIAVSDSNHAPVTVSLSAPTMVMVRGNLTLDVTASTGNGGRPWHWHWAVFYNGSINHSVAVRLADIMNNGMMQWFGCIPQSADCGTLSGDLLSLPGDYSFSLTLVNFLGMYDTATVAVNIIPDYFVPSVRIIGSSFASVYSNNSMVLRVFIDSSFVCPVPLEIDWMTYIDNTASPVKNAQPNQDPRTLLLPANSLIPNHLYRFQVNVFCDTAFSYAYVERYVQPVTLSTVFVSGLDTILSLKYPFFLNGSLEYPLSVYGNPSDVSFSWSCLQVVPLDTKGCDSFYNEINLSSPLLSFFEPEKIFSPSVQYRFDLHISSPSLGASFVTYQTVRTLGEKIVDVPQIEVSVPELFVTTQFGYVINATVKGASTFVSTWEILSTQQVLYSRVFVDGCDEAQFFPAIVSPSLLQSRYSFQFRLSAFVPSDSCFSVSCMDSSMVTSITFTTTVNRPPSSGSLEVIPPEGNENTVFSILAHNWQDTDLPIGYEFYQSTNGGKANRLIRQRMILPFTQARLVVFPTEAPNVTVLTTCYVYDYYGARTISTAPINYYFSNPIWNASHLVTRALESAFEVKRQLAGEYILSVMAGIVDAVEKLNCYSLGAGAAWDDQLASECIELVFVGTKTLAESAAYYNQGIGLSLGVARYLSYLVSIDTRAITPTLIASILQLYGYVNSAVHVVSLQDSQASELVRTLLASSDKMVDLLSKNTTIPSFENSMSFVAPLSLAMTSLVSQYFALLPFGVEDEFASLKYFDVSMNKNYFAHAISVNNNSAWEVAASLSAVLTPVTGSMPSALSNTMQADQVLAALTSAHDLEKFEDSVMINDIAFSRNIFPPNGTVSYEILTMNDRLPITTFAVEDVRIVESQHISGATNLRFRIFADSLNNQEEEMSLTMYFVSNASDVWSDLVDDDLWHQNQTDSLVNTTSFLRTARVYEDDSVGGGTAAAAIGTYYQNCSDADSASHLLPEVQCSSADTNGPSFVFPRFQCPLQGNFSMFVRYVCPVFENKVGCFRNGEWFGNATYVAAKEGIVLMSCRFPLTDSTVTRTSHRKLIHESKHAQDSISISGYFSIAKITFEVETANTLLLEVDNPRSTVSSSSSASRISYIAIVSIALAAVLFAAFVYYRMKHYRGSGLADADNQLQSTDAVIVPQVPLTTAEILLPEQYKERVLPKLEEAEALARLSCLGNRSNQDGQEEELGKEQKEEGEDDSSLLVSSVTRSRPVSLESALTLASVASSSSMFSVGNMSGGDMNGEQMRLPRLRIPFDTVGADDETNTVCSAVTQSQEGRSRQSSAASGEVDVAIAGIESSLYQDLRPSINHSAVHAGESTNDHGIHSTSSQIDIAAVPFIESADVEMIHIDAVAYLYTGV